jgi:hypothetical protein
MKFIKSYKQNITNEFELNPHNYGIISYKNGTMISNERPDCDSSYYYTEIRLLFEELDNLNIKIIFNDDEYFVINNFKKCENIDLELTEVDQSILMEGIINHESSLC